MTHVASKKRRPKRKMSGKGRAFAFSREWQQPYHWRETFSFALQGILAGCAGVAGHPSLDDPSAIAAAVHDAEAVADYACGWRPKGCGRPVAADAQAKRT